jgi:hypothetical protein
VPYFSGSRAEKQEHRAGRFTSDETKKKQEVENVNVNKYIVEE